jgi:glycerol-3-phosphate dehydrogenase
MKNKFSSTDRKQIHNKFQSKKFDIVVIGGGITGAGIALDAASRGLSVALIEKSDFASGTSSRSTKLVHGGLRYLEHLEFRIVSQVGKERETVYSNAPHIVIPEKMLLPIIKDGKLGMFTSSLALQLYDYLAGVKESERRKMLSVEQTLKKEPLLANPELIGGALYYEYKTDDSRLVIEALKKSIEYETVALNYLEADDFIYEDDIVKGVKVIDKITGDQFEIKGEHIVNAAGVWTDQLRKKDGSLFGKRLHLTKGVHIVVSKKDFNLNHAIYFDVGDGRMVFAIPRFDVVYIGTTDTDYYENPDNVKATEEDIVYLIKAINKVSPLANIKREHIESVWAGLRPLVHEDGKSPSELSRKDEIFLSESGLISIAGGKLTGYRLMAKKVVNKILKRLPDESREKYGKCKTKSIKLSGGEFDFKPSSKKIMQEIEKRFDNLEADSIQYKDFRELFFKYGANIDKITIRALKYLYQGDEHPWLKAELWYSVNYEMTSTLSDFFVRRTGMIHFFIDQIEGKLDVVANFLADMLEWDENEKKKQIVEFKKELEIANSLN